MKLIFHILLFLFFSFHVFAQSPRIMLRNFNTDHGLASSEAHKIFQDHLGYQWIGTDNGVSSFNGYEFKNYGPLDGLEDPVVLHIQEDINNILWVCTLSGRLYKKVGNKFIAHPLNQAIKEKSKSIVQSFMIDEENNFYIGMLGKGILAIKENTISWLSETKQNIQVIKKGNKLAFATVPNDSNTNHLSLLYINNHKIYQSDNYPLSTPLISLSRACIYNNDTILLCNNEQIFIIWKDNIKFFPFKPNVNNIYAVENEIYVSFNNSNGIVRYSDIHDLLNNKGECILFGIRGGGVVEDRNKLIWINTIDNGIYLMMNKNIQLFDKELLGDAEYVTSIATIDSVSSYILLRNGSVLYINLKDNKILKIYEKKGALGYNNLAYFNDQNKLLYLSNQCNFLTFKNNKWATDNGRFCGYQTYYKNGSKNLYTLHHDGFNIIDREQLKIVYESYNKLPSYRTLSVLETDNQRIYIGNVNGLFEFKGEKLIPIDLNAGTSPIRVEALGQLQDGTLVIGTKGRGIILKKNNSILSITSADRLTSDMIECIHVDEDDNIWAGTSNGLNKLKLINNRWEITNFSTATGLPSNEINTIKSSNGIIWIGTPKGLVIINDKKYSAIPNFSKPIIENITVNNEVTDISLSSTFPYNKNNIQIQYITLAYQKFGNILYRYRFDNAKNWTTTSDKRITYIAQEGKHNFEIQSQNENNTWSESTFWAFTIKPPLWKSKWFIIGTSFLLLLAGYKFYRLRINQLSNKAKIEQEKIQLQNRALQAQMNPHFLFNCLNSIQNLILIGKSDNAVDYLGKFAKLVRNVLNTSNKNKITLESDLALLHNYLELEKIRFGEKLNFNITVDQHIDQYDIMVPPLLIQPFVENAILHGIAPLLDKKGELQITYSLINNKLNIIIIDNGIGIYQSQKQKNYNNGRTSFGMETSKQRIKLLEKNQEIFFLVQELTNENGEISGTKINIQIPV